MSGQTQVRRAGVIAAGDGRRLRHGRHTLKPLVTVDGVALVDRVLTSIGEAGPSEVAIIVNESSTAVRDHVSLRQWPFALRWIVETTPSSMHSFLRVVEALSMGQAGEDDGPFLISTVDTIAAPGAFRAFADASRALDADVVFAVVDAPPADDNPLLVRMVPNTPRVAAIGAQAAGSTWATAGYYLVRASILREADAARRDGLSALRQFFGRLHEGGFRLAAVPAAGGVDVDRPDDVGVAERFLRQVGA